MRDALTASQFGRRGSRRGPIGSQIDPQAKETIRAMQKTAETKDVSAGGHTKSTTGGTELTISNN